MPIDDQRYNDRGPLRYIPGLADVPGYRVMPPSPGQTCPTCGREGHPMRFECVIPEDTPAQRACQMEVQRIMDLMWEGAPEAMRLYMLGRSNVEMTYDGERAMLTVTFTAKEAEPSAP